MIKGKTSGGFEFEIDGRVLEDMEFVDALAETVNDNPLAFSNVCCSARSRESAFMTSYVAMTDECISQPFRTVSARSWTRSETREKTDRPCPHDRDGQERPDLRHGGNLQGV